ncbi:hypothetical protein STAQ_25270 [Allostella sp. ATCC 35155]|nr:hypothetical protein STAQ_25270 [Stella sp. ATCC 35155]
MRTTQIAAIAAGLGLALGAFPAAAAEFPSKPIEVVIPFAQGGGTDQVGRAFAQFAKPHLGVDLFVSNRTGGSGATGFAYGAQAAPDGHVITMTVTTLVSAPHTIKGYPVTYRDFKTICLISAPPGVLSVHKDSPFKTLKDLIAFGKANPKKLTFGTAGPGSNTHLIGAAFANKAGIEVRYVPHRGSGPVLTATFGKHVDVAVTDKAEALPWLTDGRLRALTVFTGEADSGLKDVPTAKAAGFDMDIGSFRALGAPKDTPAPVMAKLIDGCRKTAADKEFITFLEKTGTEINTKFGDDAAAWIKQQDELFGEAARIVSGQGS